MPAVQVQARQVSSNRQTVVDAKLVGRSMPWRLLQRSQPDLAADSGLGSFDDFSISQYIVRP